jgi:hypothetical protein
VTGPRLARAAVAVLLVLGVGACGDDDDAQPTSTTVASGDGSTTTVNDGSLPPVGASDLEPIYGDALAELGLKLTDRGGLIDRSGGGYVQSAEGDHLALYVEPIDDRTTPQYIDGIRSVAAVFGDVFDRWSGLASYDVCQEPVGGIDPEPLPVTQIELTRAEAAAFDWDTVTVVDLVRASLAEPQGLALRVSSELAIDPAYEAIVADAS